MGCNNSTPKSATPNAPSKVISPTNEAKPLVIESTATDEIELEVETNLEEGTEVKWLSDDDDQYYDGTVAEQNDDGTWEIYYEEEEEHYTVSEQDLRFIGQRVVVGGNEGEITSLGDDQMVEVTYDSDGETYDLDLANDEHSVVEATPVHAKETFAAAKVHGSAPAAKKKMATDTTEPMPIIEHTHTLDDGTEITLLEVRNKFSDGNTWVTKQIIKDGTEIIWTPPELYGHGAIPLPDDDKTVDEDEDDETFTGKLRRKDQLGNWWVSTQEDVEEITDLGWSSWELEVDSDSD